MTFVGEFLSISGVVGSFWDIWNCLERDFEANFEVVIAQGGNEISGIS